MCESGEENRKLRKIQKAKEIKPLSCVDKRKQVCQVPDEGSHLSAAISSLAFFFFPLGVLFG